MIEVPLLSGSGHVSGTISEGMGFSRTPGDPIPGVDIKLGRNPGGQLVASTQSGVGANSGQYSFDNLPANITGENYVIFVDIPGLGRISTYNFVIDAANTSFIGLDFEADSVSVYSTQTSVGIHNIATKENKFNVYPNPAKGNAVIEYSLSTDTKVSLSIYNVLGVKVSEIVNADQSAGTYKYPVISNQNGLKSGIYFISLMIDGKSITQRLIITE
jgi:hypothetical protein